NSAPCAICRPIMTVIPCRLAGVNHALVTVASSHFSTASTGCDTGEDLTALAPSYSFDRSD
ncbi:hypothetical protein U1872_21955, partial [Sphingomonas sp. RB3P16]|uniref:hypothetical protein n=1 Tax=Parasphingomonas frigoris TaxID=3096163 RepID=UPI002FC5B630